jgi:hypothetical protein
VAPHELKCSPLENTSTFGVDEPCQYLSTNQDLIISQATSGNPPSGCAGNSRPTNTKVSYYPSSLSGGWNACCSPGARPREPRCWRSGPSSPSIISFMHDRDLRCYQQIDLGGANLTAFLVREGFNVCALPWEDPAHSKTAPSMKQSKREQVCQEALEAYGRLPKPVLLMCSAGIDRSAPVAAFIWRNRSK